APASRWTDPGRSTLDEARGLAGDPARSERRADARWHERGGEPKPRRRAASRGRRVLRSEVEPPERIVTLDCSRQRLVRALREDDSRCGLAQRQARIESRENRERAALVRLALAAVARVAARRVARARGAFAGRAVLPAHVHLAQTVGD